MTEARSVSVFLRAFTAQYQAAMAKASATMSGFGAETAKTGASWNALGRRTQNAGREMSRVGTTLTRNVTLPLALLGAGSIKTAIDFETAFAGVRKTIDATEAQYRELERGIQSMSERLPASVEEISAVAEAAGQLGIQRESILSFTETMIDLGETTNLSADSAAAALARFANITGMSQKNFERLGSTLVDLGNKGASTEAEIAEMALRIAGAGNQVGLTEAQILGFAESLSSVGIQAESGGSAISRTFITMANDVAEGGKALQSFADVAGVTSAQFKTQFEDDAAGAMISFIEGLSRIKKEGGNVFKVLEDLGLSEVRVRDALLRASSASDLFAESQKTANKEWARSNALSTESEKRYKTTAAQLEMLKNKFRNILATFGNDLMPVLKDVAESLADAAKWFGNLSEEQRKNIIKWAGIAMVAGPVLRIFGGITTALGTIIRASGAALKALGLVAGAGSGVGGAATAGGAAAGASVMLPVLGAAGATALGAVAYKKGFDELGISLAGLEGPAKVAERALELLPFFGGALRGARGLQELDDWKESSGELGSVFELVAMGLFSTVRGARAYVRVSRLAGDATQRQRAQLATLIDAFPRLGVKLDDTTVSMVENLMRMGDMRGALKLLRGTLDEATDKWYRHRKGIDETTEAAADNAQKVQSMSSALKNVPKTTTAKIDTPGLSIARTNANALRDVLNQLDGRTIGITIGVTANSLVPSSVPVPTYGGQRAMGGAVRPNRYYDVGEQGPERLYMGVTGGYVVPRGRGGDSSTVINIDARGSNLTRGQIRAEVEQGIEASRRTDVRHERSRFSSN